MIDCFCLSCPLKLTRCGPSHTHVARHNCALISYSTAAALINNESYESRIYSNASEQGMTKLHGFTQGLHQNKQAQTFALILQQGFGSCTRIPSSNPSSPVTYTEINLFLTGETAHKRVPRCWGWMGTCVRGQQGSATPICLCTAMGHPWCAKSSLKTPYICHRERRVQWLTEFLEALVAQKC